jgi:FixJ family two-component response regulator
VGAPQLSVYYFVIQIVDDNTGTRTALERLLKAAGFKTRAFKSAADFLLAGPDSAADCVILDVLMPGMGGIELQKTMGLAGNSVPIIFLTCHGTIPVSVEAMKAGAVDFLTKPVEKDDLLRAVRAAIQRREVERKKLAAQQILKDRFARLTPREMEVFVLVVRGKMNKQIAAELGTGEQNIKIHRSHVMSKMQADSLADLVTIGQRLGISAQNPLTLSQPPMRTRAFSAA